jgi:hypothetical protein
LGIVYVYEVSLISPRKWAAACLSPSLSARPSRLVCGAADGFFDRGDVFFELLAVGILRVLLLIFEYMIPANGDSTSFREDE